MHTVDGFGRSMISEELTDIAVRANLDVWLERMCMMEGDTVVSKHNGRPAFGSKTNR